jgi:GNAT superfamily N-acetyltransferase
VERTCTEGLYEEGDEFSILRMRVAMPEIEVRDKNSVLFWRHENLDNPDGRSIIALCRDAAGDVVSQFVLMPRRLRCMGERFDSFQALEVMTAPSFRGRGLFTRLGRRAQSAAAERDGRVLWGFPNRNSVRTFTARFGFRLVARPPVLVRPLSPGRWRGGGQGGGSRLVECDRFDEAHDDLIGSLNTVAPVMVERSVSRLNWRYRTIGDRVYHRFVTAGRPAGARGFAVVRLARPRRIPLAVLMEHHCIDGSGAHREMMLGVLEAVRSRLGGAAAFIALAPPHTAHYSVLRSVGFVPFAPRRFNFVVKTLGGATRLDAREAVEYANWYLSFGDEDVF